MPEHGAEKIGAPALDATATVTGSLPSTEGDKRLRMFARESGHAAREVAYRPDIDGLRAIAVMAVVFAHAGLPFFAGGFVGVDVFFVISGFLITSLIAAQHRKCQFSVGSFYVRRAKRLLPALFAMMLVTLIASWWLLIPSDYGLLAESVLYAAGFSSNVFFWHHTSGYFAPDAGAFPLLHVWSLSIEEQFYFLWPVALLLVLKIRDRWAAAVICIVLGALSFGWGEFRVRDGSTGPYFLLEARAGEFLLGALLSFLGGRRLPGGAIVANLVGALGLALVLGSSLIFTEKTPFPGGMALIPCIGTLLLIAAPQFGTNLVSRGLAAPPLVFVGLISYSVYLWHWPVVSFLRLSRVELTPVVTLGVIIASLVLGAASWWLLERKLRMGLDRGSRRSWIFAALLVVTVLSAAGLVLWRSGVPERFPFALLTQDQLLAERDRYWKGLAEHQASVRSTGRQSLIVGDSHANDLLYALIENAYPTKLRLINTYWQCYNFGQAAVAAKDTALCSERLKALLNDPGLPGAEAVYLHDHWGAFDPQGLADILVQIRARTSAPIYVFGPKMTYSQEVLSMAKDAQRERRVTINSINAFARLHEVPGRRGLDRKLKAFFSQQPLPPNVKYISVLDAQCGSEGACATLSPAGEYLYFDASHFTLIGSRYFGARLKAKHPEIFQP